jgi:hypothetical protein
MGFGGEEEGAGHLDGSAIIGGTWKPPGMRATTAPNTRPDRKTALIFRGKMGADSLSTELFRRKMSFDSPSNPT